MKLRNLFAWIVLFMFICNCSPLKAGNYKQPIVLNLHFNGKNIEKNTKVAIVNYYNNSTIHLTDSLIEVKKIYITLYPEEDDYFTFKNTKKYMDRANALIMFIRKELEYKGVIEVAFESQKETIEIVNKKNIVSGTLTVMH